MLRLKALLQQRPSGTFDSALKHHLESLAPGSLPLDHGLSRCGVVDDSRITVTVIRSRQTETGIQARIGVFFTEIVAGCVCGEDPTPENAYCELLIDIDPVSGNADCEPVHD